MSLVIVSSKATQLPNPEEEWNYPDKDDFTYRDNPEKFAADCDEFQKMTDQYEAEQEDAEADTFQIGYGAFKSFRAQLALPLGFHYYVKDSSDPFSWWLQRDRDDSIEADAVGEFLLHSDCDGELGSRCIRTLFSEMNKLTPDQTKTINRYEEFYTFTRKSAENGLHWIFC
ncbi:hypothetical protein [Lactiplantibacillus modestisalitolerans]|uniref:Prophage protein n=1 Tax=Lactiplantibacillus modestisalitolerans TaxID=1457219 RepID=A0ABV5WX77_9LACO|nr:hypothetical protein [Lactiplantibacillus modestisalitolerans]